MVILSVGLEAQPDAAKVATLFGISRSADGFFAEAHPKLRPVETNTDGVFLAGCAQGPRDVPDTVAHAGAAASMAIALLNRGEVTISPTVANVNEKLCSACKTCLSVCPYQRSVLMPMQTWRGLTMHSARAAAPVWLPALPPPSRDATSPTSRSSRLSKGSCESLLPKPLKEPVHE